MRPRFEKSSGRVDESLSNFIAANHTIVTLLSLTLLFIADPVVLISFHFIQRRASIHSQQQAIVWLHAARKSADAPN